MMAKQQTQQGFTLFELIVVVAIIGILAAMATPSFARMLAEKRAEQGAMDIVYAFDQARLQAALSGKQSTLIIEKVNTPKPHFVFKVQFFDTSGTSVLAKTSEYVLSDKVLLTHPSLGSNTALNVLSNGQIVKSSSAMTSNGTIYFRVCPNTGLQGLHGYTVWINSMGISRFVKGKVSGVGNDGATNTNC